MIRTMYCITFVVMATFVHAIRISTLETAAGIGRVRTRSYPAVIPVSARMECNPRLTFEQIRGSVRRTASEEQRVIRFGGGNLCRKYRVCADVEEGDACSCTYDPIGSRTVVLENKMMGSSMKLGETIAPTPKRCLARGPWVQWQIKVRECVNMKCGSKKKKKCLRCLRKGVKKCAKITLS